ncbi:MAG: hypothetical protein ACJ8EL_21430 [Rhizomicrobium sp.]|jgi:hypothetical protein
MFEKFVGIVLAALATSTIIVRADAESSCTLPLAAKKEVALGIFSAIVSGTQTTKRRHSYETKIDDQGDRWSVYQVLKGGDSVKYSTAKNGQRMETVKVTAGGGGLEMTINKCTAVVSDAHLSR